MSLDQTSAVAGHSRSGNIQPITEVRDMRSLRSRLNPKDLVDLLLSHGARAWRASQPVSRSRVKVTGIHGRAAVRISFGRTV
ncbi:hypothetical protein [Fulvimarina sp. MAC3]|uniref:hypothetical protein n=1 Tax=Fulvimarina sp. MAC3 TaxID=3148887 RepID=UPI0031FC3DDF